MKEISGCGGNVGQKMLETTAGDQGTASPPDPTTHSDLSCPPYMQINLRNVQQERFCRQLFHQSC